MREGLPVQNNSSPVAFGGAEDRPPLSDLGCTIRHRPHALRSHPGAELELELAQFLMAQKPMLRSEVGARALRVRSDVRGHESITLR